MKEESKLRPWLGAVLAAALVAVALVPAVTARAAEARTVLPPGRAVGIKLFSDGVMVGGFSEVAGETGSSAPARDCGLREGDIITHINGEEITGYAQLSQHIREAGVGGQLKLTVFRQGQTLELTVTIGENRQQNNG